MAVAQRVNVLSCFTWEGGASPLHPTTPSSPFQILHSIGVGLDLDQLGEGVLGLTD